MTMFRKFTALVLILSLLAGMFMVAGAKSAPCYTTGNANMRKGPGLNYSVITSIPNGAEMTYSETARDGRGVVWAKVKYKGHTGWVSAVYLSKTKGGTSSKGKIKMSGNGYIRVQPNKSSKSQGVCPAGATVSWFDSAKDSRGVKWYLIHYNGISGWVSSANVGGGSSSATKVTATGGNSYIRNKPSLNGKAIAGLPKGATATYLGPTKYDDRKVAWYYVRYNGTEGWVSSKYTTKK